MRDFSSMEYLANQTLNRTTLIKFHFNPFDGFSNKNITDREIDKAYPFHNCSGLLQFRNKNLQYEYAANIGFKKIRKKHF